MVEGLLQPLNIFILGLGGGFLIPLLYRIAKPLPAIAFAVALCGIAVLSGASLWQLYRGAGAIEILTAGSVAPFSISLRFGPWEGLFAFATNIAALLAAWHLRERLAAGYASLLLYLIVVMGINGMVMTRDLFNLFVFLEIVSIGTYGLLGLGRTPAALAASFKYIMATVLASSFFLLGSVLLYHVTGTLNIDDMVANRALITGPIGTTALLFVLACLVLELKPFPANGWGLDVYETAPSGVAAFVSVGVSAGVFFALFKLLPLFEHHLGLLAVSGGATFLFSNLAGLRQTKVQRLLGYSSIAQMGLLTLALAAVQDLGAEPSLPVVIGGLFINHLFAKAGLFFIAGAIGRERVDDWSGMAARPHLLFVFALLLVAIAGLPPFPGFWAKWELVMQLAAGGQHVWIAVILAGSLFEAAYMFRWFRQATREAEGQEGAELPAGALAPALVCVVLLAGCGYAVAQLAGAASLWLFAPLYAGVLLYLCDWLSGRAKCAMMLIVVAVIGNWLIADLVGLRQLFAVLLLAGSLVIGLAGFYRSDPRPGYYPLMAVMLLSIAGLLRAATSLEFFYSWELITLSTYFLIARTPRAQAQALPFLLFSLGSAYCLLAGFALAAAVSGTTALSAFAAAGPDAALAFVLLAVGFLIKAGAAGVHIWLPGAYAEADDDLSAMLSAVVSKVAMFGLFMVTYLAIRSALGLELAHAMGWIGGLTTVVGAVLALRQDDMKRMLAYSSMSQLGYIITAIALMSHLGWVTAFYLVANHLMVKGILFLAVAGVILRTGMRSIDATAGLARVMPFTSVAVLVALVSMSGLPPLAGFGGKWLLLSAMMSREWYGLVALGALATFIGFLYMFRLGRAFFKGGNTSQAAHTATAEAPVALLLPQYLLIAGILVLSFFPKLVMDPVSAAIDPYFASTLVWQGMSLEMIYGYWNPMPVMVTAVVIAAVLFAVIWMAYSLRRGSPRSTGPVGLHGFYRPLLEAVSPPVAIAFWDGIAALMGAAGEGVRRIYTGNGQTYVLYVLYFVAAVCLAGTYGPTGVFLP